MQRSGTRLLDILTTAAKHISICSSGFRVLGARAPYRAAYSSAHYRVTDTAFHCDRIGGAAHHDHSIPSLWQPLADQRRYKSKKKAGKESKGSSVAADTQVDVTFDTGPYEQKMVQKLEHCYHELAGLRTGRASPTLLDGILVDINGEKMNLKHLATVVMKGTRTLAVTVYDRDTTQAVASAIKVSPLDLQVREEGGQLIVPIPEMSPSARAAMVKLAHQHAEHARVAVRQIRHKAMGDVKAVMKQIGEDEKKKREKRIDELTKKFIADVDVALASKEKELKL